MPGNLDLSSVRSALPSMTVGANTSTATSGGHGARLPVPLYTITEEERDMNQMDVNHRDPKEWVPDQASFEYLRNLTRKSNGHRRARRVQVTNSWIQAKFAQLPDHKRDRLLAGHPVEDAIVDYDVGGDEDACLHVSKFAKGTDLAACLRNHIRLMCSKATSKQAFPSGRVTLARRTDFLANRYDPVNPDLGSTAEKCCPDLDGAPRGPWNLTFCESVAKDFIAKVSTGCYLDYDLPAEATNEEKVITRVKTCIDSMIKRDRRIKKLNTAEKITLSNTEDKYMQRRRSKHETRLRNCDASPKYQKFFGLMKLVGPEGNSDEETDRECDVTPAPIKVFPLKWRSKAYERLLHSLDLEQKRRESHPLLHAGPMRSSARSAKKVRARDRATNAAKKFLPISCPAGKPSQFYDTTFIRDATAQGFLPSLRIGTGYPHELPGA